MSVVSLAANGTSKVTKKELQQSIDASGFAIDDDSERRDYMLLLQSADAVIQAVDDGDDYIHPDLEPLETLEERSYWRPDDNPLNAWSHRCELQARSPRLTLLQGRSIVLKDNISVGGLPTTLGTFAQFLSKDGKYPISPIDATVVRRLLEAGATIKGTATCENYSLCPLSYSSASGPVHNPWLKGYNVGGSSSGAGALVGAAGMAKSGRAIDFGEVVDLAIGGDQGGSLRLPASYAGIYGLKPTHGLVPYTGTASLIPMLDHIGPMATTVHDIALLLQAIAGFDGIDQRMTAEAPLRSQVHNYPKLVSDYMAEVNSGEMPQLRVAFLKEGFDTAGLSDQVRDTVLNSAKDKFATAGVTVGEVSIPMHNLGPAIWTAATRASMADFAFKGQTPGYLNYAPPHLQLRWPMDDEMYHSLTATNPAVVNVALSGQHLKRKFGNHAEAKAHRKVFELRAAYDAAFKQVDILITPTTPTIAMTLPKLKLIDSEGSSVMDKLSLSIGSTANTCPFNVTGHPAISVPCGFAVPDYGSTTTELPVGMQLIARRWDEVTLLKAAALFEAAHLGIILGHGGDRCLT